MKVPFVSDLFDISGVTGSKRSCPVVTEHTTHTHSWKSEIWMELLSHATHRDMSESADMNQQIHYHHMLCPSASQKTDRKTDYQRQHDGLDIPAWMADQRSVFDNAVHTCNLTLEVWPCVHSVHYFLSAHRMTDYKPTAQTPQRTNEYSQMKASCLHSHTEHLQ